MKASRELVLLLVLQCSAASRLPLHAASQAFYTKKITERRSAGQQQVEEERRELQFTGNVSGFAAL